MRSRHRAVGLLRGTQFGAECGRRLVTVLLEVHAPRPTGSTSHVENVAGRGAVLGFQAPAVFVAFTGDRAPLSGAACCVEHASTVL